MSVRVEAYPRIHIGLLDLSGTTSRVYGGAGFSFEGPSTVLEVETSTESSLSAPHLEKRDRRDLLVAIERWESKTDGNGIDVEFLKYTPQHVGLGSKTAMLLGILSGANTCWDADFSRQELQSLSERGGVSGIGIHTFFGGGFLVDLGQPESAAPPFKPSSSTTPNEIPPIAIQTDFPTDWRITLYLPHDDHIYGEEEVKVFKQNTPLPPIETRKALSLTYHGIVPAFLNQDLEQLATSLKQFHQTGFKEREVQAHSQNIRSVLQELQSEPGVAAGMSSMGPLIYAIHHKDRHPPQPRTNKEVDILGPYLGRNNGANIS